MYAVVTVVVSVITTTFELDPIPYPIRTPNSNAIIRTPPTRSRLIDTNTIVSKLVY